jgi:hypothetical protein
VQYSHLFYGIYTIIMIFYYRILFKWQKNNIPVIFEQRKLLKKMKGKNKELSYWDKKYE